MTTPKISFLIPLYNAEQYIQHCLETVLAQTWTDFEVICVDDCSKDRSVEIAKTVLGAQTVIPWTLIQNETNQGVAETRKIGTAQARGDFMLCVDADDYVAPELAGTVYRAAMESNADIVIFGATNVSPDGKVNYLVDSGDGIITGAEGVARTLALSLQGYCWNKLIRRDIFSEVHHPRGLIYEDVYVCVQSLARANTVRLIPDKLYYYVKRENSLSVGFNPRIVDLLQIIDLIEKEARPLRIPDYDKLFFRFKYIFGYRTVAFQAARLAPSFAVAEPILVLIHHRLRLSHLMRVWSDHRPKLAVALFLLKLHPRFLFRFVRATSGR